MDIGGLQKFSLIDYPGKICAIIFTQGCNFKCPYCHNPELSNPDLYGTIIPEEEIFSFLEKRKGKLDAITITGGEPTLQSDLIDFIKRIKEMSYLVKLDTNGSHPDVLVALIKNNLIDYIAMDVKAPWNKYQKITRSAIKPDIVKKSIDLISKSTIPYEFRTTVVKSQLSMDDLVTIGKNLKNTKLYVLQKFVPSKTRDPKYLKKKTYSNDDFEKIREKIEKYVEKVVVR
ncbi:MAG: anaerobic ribonucleoside-triphosphate reductase activating protein [Deltaproteobacteria bacterium]|nr:anaerobic ribonucleoside-triphosphate reductase activating protein [Deltaproteobacteria bacterium]